MSDPREWVSGAKRANIEKSEWSDGWWVGYGKDESCQFEGSWEDMVSFANAVLEADRAWRESPEGHA